MKKRDAEGAGPAGGTARRRGQGELEAQVLAAVRAAGGPVTAGRVRERLGGGLAYTTVITILTRLHAKGAVARERVGRSFEWTAVADEAGLAALRMRRLLDGEGDRQAVLARFVTTLPASDEQLLRELLARAEGEAEAVGEAEAEGEGDGAGGE
ncbi:BlaI/MecI/CopY family transcriptional regulator [Streptomyces sp. R302]|uniref:BlaI/MecI/CopY family transcriptional regulator n=1 Tax=unclassified Streptomyces TaxID=2593676 RepID=UPI00145CC9E7|nr:MULTISPECIES: BlaI/MecI/CopY family transcriptional regulator [unclassified Streptomyces]NML51264.1 BlaI/MecI/CopY family transcriptional regulator [Streptomyces sp. R301]NML79842.1 BlaI/MecI/CopY family transcriptional regulator [Streptomyces sp. R302]